MRTVLILKNKDENVYRFALSGLGVELLERESETSKLSLVDLDKDQHREKSSTKSVT